MRVELAFFDFSRRTDFLLGLGSADPRVDCILPDILPGILEVQPQPLRVNPSIEQKAAGNDPACVRSLSVRRLPGDLRQPDVAGRGTDSISLHAALPTVFGSHRAAAFDDDCPNA